MRIKTAERTERLTLWFSVRIPIAVPSYVLACKKLIMTHRCRTYILDNVVGAEYARDAAASRIAIQFNSISSFYQAPFA